MPDSYNIPTAARVTVYSVRNVGDGPPDTDDLPKVIFRATSAVGVAGDVIALPVNLSAAHDEDVRVPVQFSGLVRGTDFEWVSSPNGGNVYTGDLMVIPRGSTDENLYLRLLSITGGTLTSTLVEELSPGVVIEEAELGNDVVHTTTINDSSGVLPDAFFSEPDDTVNEGGESIVFVRLTSLSPDVETVAWTTDAPGSAYTVLEGASPMNFNPNVSQRRLRIRWEQNLAIGDQSYTFTLNPGGTSVGIDTNNDTYDVTIRDDDLPQELPVLNWVSRTASTTEQQVVVSGILRLSLPAPAGGIEVTLEPVTGTATPNLDFVLLDGNSVTIAEGETEVPVRVQIVNDLDPEESETIRIKIFGSDATLPIERDFTITIFSSDLAAGGFGQLEVSNPLTLRPGVTSPLATGIISLAPGEVLDGVWTGVDGTGPRAQTAPLTYTLLGDGSTSVKTMRVTAPTDGAPLIPLAASGDLDLPTDALWNDVDLTDVSLQLAMPNVSGVPMISNCFGGAQSSTEILEDGPYMRITKHYSRFRSTAAPHDVLQVWAYVTRRSDTDCVQVTLRIRNAAYDVTANPFQENPRVDGDVYYDTLRMLALPTGYEIVTDFDYPGSDFANGFFQSEISATESIFLNPRCGWRYDFVLAPTGTGDAPAADVLETAGELMRYGGVGRATGQHSYYLNGGYGGQEDNLALWDENYTYQGQTGHQAQVARMEQQLNQVLGRLDASSGAFGTSMGNSSYLFGRDAIGPNYTFGPSRAGASGGPLIHVKTGWTMHPNEWRYRRIGATFWQPRLGTGMFHHDTGEPVTAQEMADNNGQFPNFDGSGTVNGVPGHLPFVLPFDEKNPQRWHPAFLRSDTAKAGSGTGAGQYWMIPTDKPWNVPSAGRTSPLSILGNPFVNSDSNWNVVAPTHIVRYTAFIRDLAYGTGDHSAIDDLRMERERLMTAVSEHPISGAIVSNFAWTKYSLPNAISLITSGNPDQSYAQWGCARVPVLNSQGDYTGAFDTHFLSRDYGHCFDAIGMGVSFEDLAWRQDRLSWFRRLCDWEDVCLAPGGGGWRSSWPDGKQGGNYPGEFYYYGEQDTANRRGVQPVGLQKWDGRFRVQALPSTQIGSTLEWSLPDGTTFRATEFGTFPSTPDPDSIYASRNFEARSVSNAATNIYLGDTAEVVNPPPGVFTTSVVNKVNWGANNDPVVGTGGQSYVTSFHANGLAALQIQFGALDPTRSAILDREVVDFSRHQAANALQYGWNGMPAWTLISEGLNGIDDPPSERPMNWDVHGLDTDPPNLKWIDGTRSLHGLFHCWRKTGNADALSMFKRICNLPDDATLDDIRVRLIVFCSNDNGELDRTWAVHATPIIGYLQSL